MIKLMGVLPLYIDFAHTNQFLRMSPYNASGGKYLKMEISGALDSGSENWYVNNGKTLATFGRVDDGLAMTNMEVVTAYPKSNGWLGRVGLDPVHLVPANTSLDQTYSFGPKKFGKADDPMALFSAKFNLITAALTSLHPKNDTLVLNASADFRLQELPAASVPLSKFGDLEHASTNVSFALTADHAEFFFKKAKRETMTQQDEIHVELNDPNIQDPSPESDLFVTIDRSATFKYVYTKDMKTIANIGVFYDDVTKLYQLSLVDISDSADDREAYLAKAKELDAAAYTIGEARKNGEEVKYVVPTYPFEKFTDEALEREAQGWWRSHKELAELVNAVEVGDKSWADEYAELDIATRPAYSDWLESKMSTVEKSAQDGRNSSVWSGMLDGLGSLWSGAGNYITQQSPLDWVTAYAGYSAVKSVNSAKSPWLWVAIGVGVVLLLK